MSNYASSLLLIRSKYLIHAGHNYEFLGINRH